MDKGSDTYQMKDYKNMQEPNVDKIRKFRTEVKFWRERNAKI